MEITAIQEGIVKRQNGSGAFINVNDKRLTKTRHNVKFCSVLAIILNKYASFVQKVCLTVTRHPLNVHMTSQSKRVTCDTSVQRLACSGCSTLTFFVSKWDRPPFIPRHFVKSTSSLPSDHSVIVKCHLVLSGTEEIVLVLHVCVCACLLFVCENVSPTFWPYIFPTAL